MLTDSREHFQPFQYPMAAKFLESQEKVFWNSHEIQVGRDVQQYHSEFTESEKHLIVTLLKVFTEYELHVGCFWSDVVAKEFGGHWEVAAMAKIFSATENVHALFYNKLNEGLYLNDAEFYNSFKLSPSLSKNINIITKHLENPSLLSKLAAFSFVEGVKLYGSFAVLLNFPRQGKLRGVENGLKYSVSDEALHCRASSWLYKQLSEETSTSLSNSELHEMARSFVDVEIILVEELFSKGTIEGITQEDVVEFVKHRADRVLTYLGSVPLYGTGETKISEWFYTFINAQEDTDFFVSKATEYEQGWNFSGVVKW